MPVNGTKLNKVKKKLFLFGDNEKQTIFALPFKTGKKLKFFVLQNWLISE
jgi:hypothetical protein